MSPSRFMSQRGGGHVHTSSSSSTSSSSKARSSTSPVLSNSSFGSLDYFASLFEAPSGPRHSLEREPESRVKYASFSDTPSMTFPVPHLHLGSHVASPASPTLSNISISSTADSDLHGVGLAALCAAPSPVSPEDTIGSPGPSSSAFRPTADMRKKLALHRRTVLFPEARVVNWARPFRAQGHAQQHVRDASLDLLPSPQFDLEDLCQEAFQMKPVDTLFGASAQRQRRLRNASPSLSPASTDSSAGPLTPDATPPLSDGPDAQLNHNGNWQVGFEGKGLGIDKVQHGLHRLSWTDTSKTASPVITTPPEEIEVEEILLNDDPTDNRSSFIATASILDHYADESHSDIPASPPTPTTESPVVENKMKESTSEATTISNQFEYSSLLSSSSMASLDSVPTNMSELQQMRQAAESLMSSLRLAQSTAIARAQSILPDQTTSTSTHSPVPARGRVASSSSSRIRRKAVPTVNVELEDSDPTSSGQSTPVFEQDLVSSQVPRSSSSPTIQKGLYALRAAAQSVPILSPRKQTIPTSPTTSTSSVSDASTSQLHTPTTPVFPGEISVSPVSVEVKQVPFQIHLESSVPPKTGGGSYGYMTRSQTLALQEQEKREKESKSRRGLARFFKPSP